MSDYYDDKLQRSGDSMRIVAWCIGALIVVAILACLHGCRSQKIIERTDTHDSASYERTESIVYVPVTITVEIPAQTAERETRDSTSHLETMFAQSDASIHWVDGVPYLHHSLANKPQQLQKTEMVPVKHVRLRYFRTICRTKYVYKHIEKQLSLYQRAVLNFGPWIILSLIIYIIYLRSRLRRQGNV